MKIIVIPFLAILVISIDSIPLHDINTNSNGLSGTDDAFAVGFMLKFGYLPPNDPRIGRFRTKTELDDAIKEVQRFAGLKVTGELNAETMEMMKKPRCGMPDFGPSDMMRRKKRYALHSTKWNKLDLTYRIINGPRTTKITIAEVHEVIRTAFKMWSEVSQLTFRKLYSGTADIMISFQAGVHDDGYPFDGTGGTLAHGFFPDNNPGLSGDVHFDDDESWVLNTKYGTDFFWTAVHEIGHSLGLDHSYYKKAIMYPYFLGYKENLKLGKDDELGIQVIYGKPKPTNLVTTPSPSPTTTTVKIIGPNACQTDIDAAFQDTVGSTYFFKGKYFWRLDKYNRLSKPLWLRSYWPELRSRVQAAYTRPDGKTVFFKGRRFWVYEGTNYIAGPKFITEYGLPIEMKQLDAVFVWGGNRKTYFFKGSQYWRYNEVTRRIDPGYPRNISDSWGVVAQPVDAVMTWKDGDTYFFKGRTVQRYDFYNQHNEIAGENIGEYFMGCKEAQVSARGPENSAKKSSFFTPALFLLSLVLTIQLV